MLYTAYLDESDTHGPAPTIIMGAFLGTARQWEILGRRLRKFQRRDGFSVFHATEFKSKTGEFSGWTDAKCKQLLEDLTALVRDELTEGLVVHLEHERFINEYRAPPIPRKMNLDSQYGVCFRACMAHLLKILLSDNKRHRLNIVVEDGHVNVGGTVTIFKEFKKVLERQGIKLLGEIKIAAKDEAPPCMLADFLAHTYSMMRASAKTGGLDYKKEAPEPSKGEAGLSFLELLPDALRQLKLDFQANRQRAIDAWHARKKTADDAEGSAPG